MGGLKRVTFREFVTLQRGFDLPKKNIKAGIYPVVGSTSIIGYHAEFKANPPGVVIGRSGSLGSVLYVSDKYWPHNTSLWVRDFKGNIPKYVYYFLQTLELQRYDSGAAVPTLNRNHLDSLELRIHHLSTQRKIAALLGNYDDLIENNTRRIKILEEMACTIYREWFVEFRFPGHENVKMVESELGLIPQGWEIVKLSDIVELTRKGITPSKFPEEIFAHFSIPAFDSEGLPMLDAGDTIKSSKYVVPPDCVLISKLNPQIPRVWLPLINTVHRPIASTEFLIIKPKSLVDCVHLFHLFQSLEFSREFSVQRLGTSRSHQRVSSEGFLGMPVLLPNKSFLNEFHEKVNSIVNLCNTLRLKNTNLRQTRDLLLPKLISGEIDVSELDINTVTTE